MERERAKMKLKVVQATQLKANCRQLGVGSRVAALCVIVMVVIHLVIHIVVVIVVAPE
jgi:hypothetical protein